MLVEKEMNWFITGGCGFIGTNLISRLLNESPKPKIRVLDNLTSGTRKDLSQVCEFVETDISSFLESKGLLTDGVELIVGDIRDFDTCHAESRDIDVIVHLAANTGVGPSVENPREDMEANVIGTFNMLEAARHYRIKRFIFASSGAPAGEVEPPIHEELAPHPVSPYGASKLSGEGYCSAFYHSFGIETVSLRFGNVYGPGSKHKNSVVAKFIRQAVNGEKLEIFGDGKQTRDFIYIADLIEAIIISASIEGIGGETFQIATNAETTVQAISEKLLMVFQKNGIEKVQIVNTSPRKGDVIRNFSDTSKAKRLLGWQAKTDLETGLNQTFYWFLNASKPK